MSGEPPTQVDKRYRALLPGAHIAAVEAGMRAGSVGSLPMRDRREESATDAAASLLRGLIASGEDGAFLGDEGQVRQRLNVSRATLRQAARLLEREGLLAVRRGARGGYYACRPSPRSVEAAVTAHLEMLDVHADELSTMASIIWIELVQQATRMPTPAGSALVRRLVEMVDAVPEGVSHRALGAVEQRIRTAICDVVDSPYIQFIFRMNIAFAERRFGHSADDAGDTVLPAGTLADWRRIKLLELEAIAQGDEELAILAATRSRRFWRAISHLPGTADVRHRPTDA